MMVHRQDTLYFTRLGLRDYEVVWRAMQNYSLNRDALSPDLLWQVEHPPVFTLGLNGKAEHLLAPGDIPVVNVDRGGQVTYHGPGQLVVYTLIDLNRHKLGIRELVSAIEQAVIHLLADHGLQAIARKDAPGVYVDGAKIAALGLRVKKGCSYHGLSLNVDMDPGPFSLINPCGYADMPVTQLKELGIQLSMEQAGNELNAHLQRVLGYNSLTETAAGWP